MRKLVDSKWLQKLINHFSVYRQDQDGGKGHVGTVVEIGGRSNNTSPEKTVVVQWDSGMRTNYRCGYQNAYDLRVYDNAQCGVKHPNVSCRGCQRRTIKGFLFKCTKCADVSLCSACYFADKHELSHSFYRIDTPASRSVKVAKRADSERLTAKGMFVGAVVVRGHDWNWNDQDGGSTKTGRVQEIRGWEQESFRSVACVHWFATRITSTSSPTQTPNFLPHFPLTFTLHGVSACFCFFDDVLITIYSSFV
jgi:E3 ubiquitin-protein ligase mind-bomb